MFLVEEYRQTNTWIRHHLDEWNLVQDKWASTSRLRLWEVSKIENLDCVKIVDLFPALCNSEGYQLVQLDFSTKFNSKQDLLFERWNNFRDRVCLIFEADITDSAGKVMLELMKDNEISEGMYLMKVCD